MKSAYGLRRAFGFQDSLSPVDLEARRHQLETALTHAENALAWLSIPRLAESTRRSVLVASA
jgi:hypothetical protein